MHFSRPITAPNQASKKSEEQHTMNFKLHHCSAQAKNMNFIKIAQDELLRKLLLVHSTSKNATATAVYTYWKSLLLLV